MSYLETIKHVFDIRGMVFVLAIDYDHLAGSTRALFGQDLNFEEYFRKFCHRVIDLPKPDEKGFGRLATDYVQKYLSIEGKRICGIQLDQDRIRQIVELGRGLGMKPRQLQEAFRIVGHVSALADPQQRGQLRWAIAAMTLFLAFLKVSQRETYLRIKNDEILHEEVGRLLISIFGKENAEWWFKIYLTGLSDAAAAAMKPEVALSGAGFSTGQTFEQSQEFSQFRQGWGMVGSSKLPDIFRRIETVDSFR